MEGVRNADVALREIIISSHFSLCLSPQNLSRRWLVSPRPPCKRRGRQGTGPHPWHGDVTSWVEGEELPSRTAALCFVFHSPGSRHREWDILGEKAIKRGEKRPVHPVLMIQQRHSHSKCFYLPSRNKSSPFACRQSDGCAFYSKTRWKVLP